MEELSEANGAKGKNQVLERRSMVVQRLSSGVVGAAQKYKYIGAREFVAYEYDNFNLDNIKVACKHHFEDCVDDCDVLLEDRGPSISSVDQLPDLKVIYMRFIERSTPSEGNRAMPASVPNSVTEPTGKKQNSNDNPSHPIPKKTYMKSISVLNMVITGYHR